MFQKTNLSNDIIVDELAILEEEFADSFESRKPTLEERNEEIVYRWEVEATFDAEDVDSIENRVVEGGSDKSSDWTQLRNAGFDTADEWTLQNRKLKKGEKATSYGLISDSNGNTTAEIPLYHREQTRPSRIHARTKAYIHFKRLFGFDRNQHIYLCPSKGWLTINANPNAASPSDSKRPDFIYQNWFGNDQIRSHVNGKDIYGGFCSHVTRTVYLDVDFHHMANETPCLEAVRLILRELPSLMNKVNGYGVHCQVADNEAQGIHIGFFLRSQMQVVKVQEIVNQWLEGLKQQHKDLFKRFQEATKYYCQAKKGIVRVDGFVDHVFPKDSKGFRLPLCKGRTMLLDRPLSLVADGRPDVVGFIEWQQSGATSMPCDESIEYLSVRLKQAEPIEIPTTPAINSNNESPVAKPKSVKPKVTQAKGRANTSDRKLIWKNNTRRNFAKFFYGVDNPRGSLEEVACVLARFAPHYTKDVEDAVAIYEQLVRDIPESGWHCSGRLQKRDFKPIISPFRRMAERAFNNNLPQKDSVLSQAKIRKCVEVWKEVGYNPYDISTYHFGFTKFKLEVDWTADDKIDFHQALEPLMGRAKVDVERLVNMAASLVLEKEKHGNGLALGYWMMFFEDQFGIACGDTSGTRRHQRIVNALLDLGVIEVRQKAIFRQGLGSGRGRGFTTGKRLNERKGWQCRLMSEDEQLAWQMDRVEEVFAPKKEKKKDMGLYHYKVGFVE